MDSYSDVCNRGKGGGTGTFASSMALFGIVILGNAYTAPCTSLHLTPSIELRTSVVNFAFSL